MKSFVINSNTFLNKSIQAYCHADYSSGGQWKVHGTMENIICTLKNDITPYSVDVLRNASLQLEKILLDDLPELFQKTQKGSLTVCVVPRAKIKYNSDQLLFRETVINVINKLKYFYNGTHYIVRHTDTKTTHRAKFGHGGNGSMPYKGITNETCYISEEVKGKDILLIDDLYTKTVNIDEDAIQALLDKGASSVVFYAVGNTIFNKLATK